jgi:hypothetical protein
MVGADLKWRQREVCDSGGHSGGRGEGGRGEGRGGGENPYRPQCFEVSPYELVVKKQHNQISLQGKRGAAANTMSLVSCA